MYRCILICVLLLLGISGARAGGYVPDSLNRKFGFHILTSVRPIVKWLGKKDSSENFFYSRVQFEVQFNFKKHMLGVGFNGNQKQFSTPVNGVDTRSNSKTLSFAPTYSYRFYSKRRLKGYVGLAYIYNSDEVISKVNTKIEVITKRTSTIEEGTGLFFRLNYSLNRHFSVEIESSFYATRSKIEYEEDYPLTPSLKVLKVSFLDNRTYSVPSNFLLKYTF